LPKKFAPAFVYYRPPHEPHDRLLALHTGAAAITPPFARDPATLGAEAIARLT
jgi:hypothetical protein